MRADPPKNMGYLVGEADYRAKRKIMQAPGGATQFSFGIDTASPFEGYKTKYQNVTSDNFIAAGRPNPKNAFAEPPQRVSNHYPKAFQTSMEFQSSFQAPVQPRYKNQVTEKVGKPYQTTYASMNVKSWKDVPNMFAESQVGSVQERKPVEVVNTRPSRKEVESPERLESTKERESPNIFTSQPPQDLRGSRSRSQISIHNNYKNIVSDFSPKPSANPNRETGFSNNSQFRTTNDFSESKIAWSGKKIVQPPGGATSFKFWG